MGGNGADFKDSLFLHKLVYVKALVHLRVGCGFHTHRNIYNKPCQERVYLDVEAVLIGVTAYAVDEK